jgi:hypothetical protein
MNRAPFTARRDEVPTRLERIERALDMRASSVAGDAPSPGAPGR